MLTPDEIVTSAVPCDFGEAEHWEAEADAEQAQLAWEDEQEREHAAEWGEVSRREVVAALAHRCGRCGATILIGDRCYAVKAKVDGNFQSSHECRINCGQTHTWIDPHADFDRTERRNPKKQVTRWTP